MSSGVQDDRLADAADRYRRALDVQHELICEWSADGVITFCNAAYRQFFGFGAEVVGRSLDDFVDWEPGAGIAAAISDLRDVAHRRVVSREYDDGRIVEWTDSAVHDSGGEVVSVVSVGRDVTEAIRATRSLEESLRQRIGFIAEASHALRNPLHGMLGLSEMLVGAHLEPHLADAAWAIFRQASTMRAIVDDLLDLAQIEVGHLRVDLAPVNLQYVMNDCVFLAQKAAPDGVTVRSGSVPPALGVVRADHDRVRQLLGNLLSNACAAATSTVHVDVVPGVEPGSVRCQVTDDGPGVVAADLPRLFQPYERGSVAGPGGVGLGLAIAKGAAEAMGGTVGALDDHEGGACFWFELPLDPSAATPSPSPGLPDGPVHYGARVLVVEDDPVNQMLARLQLERLGSSVTVAGDGLAGWDLLAAEEFDVAFVDVQMPGIDGLELVRRMAALGQRRPVTAIMTASATAADRSAAQAAGADEFVAKPATLVDIRSVLDSWARTRMVA